MGARYSVQIDATASPTSAAFDVFELNVGSTVAAVIHAIYIGQTSDVGDASSENIRVQLITGYSSSGSGGVAAANGNKLSLTSATSASTVECMNTTVANTGTAVVRHQDVFNEQIGWQYRPVPGELQEFAPSTRAVVRITGQADAITISAQIVWEEIG